MALGSADIQTQLHNLNNKTTHNSQISVDDTCQELSNIIHLAACKSLKRQKINRKKHKKHKKWFNKDLKNMRMHLLNYGKIYSKYPKDPLVKNHFYKLYRQYNKTRKQTYRQYKQSLLNQLENLHADNPKLYWNLINDLKDTKNMMKIILQLIHLHGFHIFKI